jgi:hypothetical protein
MAMFCCEQSSPPENRLSLTPGFSPVMNEPAVAKPFQRFSGAQETVETVSPAMIASTGLKPGVNERRMILAA